LADATDAGKLIIKDVIADAFLQQILTRPKEYSVIATLNLNGDYISDALAAMVGGIPNLTWFLIGLVAAVILYVINFPVMTLGLGVYLPFYLSATAFVGGLVRFIVMKAFPKYEERGTGSIIASGLLGGEAVVGVIIALTQAIPALLSI
jgi:uncharacterized oligopeptide transporter (OPT) family protein